MGKFSNLFDLKWFGLLRHSRKPFGKPPALPLLRAGIAQCSKLSSPGSWAPVCFRIVLCFRALLARSHIFNMYVEVELGFEWRSYAVSCGRSMMVSLWSRTFEYLCLRKHDP
jgi:hypothetical protein